MQTEKEVYKMLFKESKTELAAEKVELALIDDVQARAGAIQKDISRLLTLDREFFAIRKNLKNLTGFLEDAAKAQSKDISKAITALKELGLDDKEFRKYEDQIKQVYQEVNSIKKNLN